TDPVRVATDKAILSSFLESRRPVLGICYGMQLLNAVHGGSIYADFSKRPTPERNLPEIVHSSTRGGTEHLVRAKPGSRLSAILGKSELMVNTRHIQAV